MHLRRAFLWTMIVSLSLAALIGIVALLLPRLGPTDEILASTALFAAFSLVAMCCAIVIEQGRLRWLMWIGIVAGAVALLAWLVMVWFERQMDWRLEWRVGRAGGAFSVVSMWCAYFGLMTALPLRHPRAKVVKWGAIAATCLVAVFFLMGSAFPDWMERHVLGRFGYDLEVGIVGSIGILAACGTVLSPILWKVQALREAASGESIPTALMVQIVCPRCGTVQRLAPGVSRCTACSLRISIKVEEPRCACGYLLYQLEGEKCPECGRVIPPEHRWSEKGAPPA